MARSDSDLQIESIEEAKQVPLIAVQKDSAHHIYLDDLGFKNLTIAAQGLPKVGNSNLAMLLNGRVNLWMATEVSAYAKAELMSIDLKKIKPVFHLFTGELYIAFSPTTDKKIVQEWNMAFEKIKQSDSYNAVLAKYRHYNIQPGKRISTK